MEPFSIAMAIAAVLGAMGTQQQAKALEKEKRARSEKIAAENLRQAAIDRDRQETIAQNIPQFGPQQQLQNRESIAGKLEQFMAPTERPATEGEYLPANPGAPKEISENLARTLSDSLAKGRDYAKNLAGVSAYSGLNFNNALAMNNLGRDVGQLNSASARSADILPYELEEAKQAGDAARLRADLFNGAGSIASMYAMSQMATPKAPIVNAGGGLNPNKRSGLGLY